MAGGTWNAQNKVLPGVYVNYKTSPTNLVRMGERGTVAIARHLKWGEKSKLLVIDAPEQISTVLGYDQNHDEAKFVRHILLGSNRSGGAKRVLVWRLATSGDAAATVTIGGLKATAKHTGSRGNDITVVVTFDPDNPTESMEGKTLTVYVQTLVGGDVVDEQTLTNEGALPTAAMVASNDWVAFSSTGAGTLQDTTGTALSGGTDGSVSATAHSDFMTAIEREKFDIVIYDGNASAMKAAYVNFVKRISEEEGARCQCVVHDHPNADDEHVISVANQTLTMSDGTTVTADQLTWWVGGAAAGATTSQSLTNATVPGSFLVTPALTQTEQAEAIKKGVFAFVSDGEQCRVLYDINSFVSFSATKGKMLSKNRVIRTLFGIANDIREQVTRHYIGVLDNNENGLSIIKSEVLGLLYSYQGTSSLKNVSSEDVTVTQGEDVDSVLVDISIQPVDSIEKIYATIICS